MKFFSRTIISTLVLLSITATSFAATPEQRKEAGKNLQSLGIIQGDSKGNLNENSSLTREQAVVIIVNMTDKEKSVNGYAKNSGFSDIPYNSPYANYISYAKNNGITGGIGKGKFGYKSPVSTKAAVSYLLRVLGYSADWKKEDVMDKAYKLGLMDNISSTPNQNIVRGEMFVMMQNALSLPMNGKTSTLAQHLNLKLDNTTLQKPIPTTKNNPDSKDTTKPNSISQTPTVKDISSYMYGEITINFTRPVTNFDRDKFVLKEGSRIIPSSSYNLSHGGSSIHIHFSDNEKSQLYGKTVSVTFSGLKDSKSGDIMPSTETISVQLKDSDSPKAINCTYNNKQIHITFNVKTGYVYQSNFILENNGSIIPNSKYGLTYSDKVASIRFIDYTPTGKVKITYSGLINADTRKMMDSDEIIYAETEDGNITHTKAPEPTIKAEDKPIPRPEVTAAGDPLAYQKDNNPVSSTPQISELTVTGATANFMQSASIVNSISVSFSSNVTNVNYQTIKLKDGSSQLSSLQYNLQADGSSLNIQMKGDGYKMKSSLSIEISGVLDEATRKIKVTPYSQVVASATEVVN